MGDLLVLHEGGRVPADAQLIVGQLDIDRSLLTGESVPVSKLLDPILHAAGECRSAALFASTVVTTGRARRPWWPLARRLLWAALARHWGARPRSIPGRSAPPLG